MGSLLEWLLAPMSGQVGHVVDPAVAWHGRLMVGTWAVAIPVAVLAARFFKVTPRQDWPRVLDNPAWWHVHRFLNYSAVGLSLAAAWLVWRRDVGIGAAHLHGLLGTAVLATGVVQVAGGLLRGTKGGPAASEGLRGDHYDMTPRRILFERVHKSVGWFTMGASIAVVLLGLQLADAPRWMAALLVGWWSALAILGIRWQRQGRCLDTYQAIWGPDAIHPGNRMAPVGWGVRRAPPQAASGAGES